MNVVSATNSPLLQPFSSYPDAYLACRLAPRLSHLFAARDMHGKADDEFSWNTRYKGIVWSYMQLSPRLRRQCEPLYVFLQVPILLTAMRFSTSGQHDRAAYLLAGSLWNERIRQSISTELGAQHQFDLVCKQLTSYGWPLETTTPAEGHTQHLAERQIYRAALSKLHRRGLPEPLRNFSAALHDLYNLAQCRYVSDWPPKHAPLEGGRLPAKAYRSLSHLRRSVIRVYGLSLSDVADAEQQLRVNYAITLKRQARIGGVLTKLLAYLWAEFVLPESRVGWQQHLQERP